MKFYIFILILFQINTAFSNDLYECEQILAKKSIVTKTKEFFKGKI